MGNKPYYTTDRKFNNQNHRNGNNQQDKRPPKAPKYKGKNINQMGDPGRMGRYAISIFRDISRGKVKPLDQYTEFQNHEFVVAAINELQVKIREQEIYYNALLASYGHINDAQIKIMIDKHYKAIEGWTYVLNMTTNILNTKDHTFIAGLINRLPDYRYVL